MKYYIETIEQIYKDEAYSEYGNIEKVADENTALSKYYTKLSNVAADLGVNHTYMLIKVINSVGGIIKQDEIGQYIEEEPDEE